ncbi:hypothetical protein [Cellulophaga omnivescoria]|uniref:hypothetical protein n=1 Tax=Cellulophaga omnivescoria TaxID=1888890 RepID=UPI0009860B05|nr:hypothetical protein [Cellulophaga omnivescoria]WBU90929.1 hypothetical protein PBN93_07870 [Cellulophaga omnivescoria]
MNFTSPQEALIVIEEGHKKSKEAMKVGDFRTNNKIISQEMMPAFLYIEKNNLTKLLIPFLKNKDVDLSLIVSRRLLPYYEEIAINNLNDIIQKKIPHKWDVAETIIKEWKGLPL